jgi:NAD(P)-dependent dehydrogenase (short-subunit alcohol dehydrogenase family)
MPRPAKSYDRLVGLTALITGAGSQGEDFGTGKAIATLFAAEGAKVGLLDLDIDRAENTLRVIEAEGGEGLALCGDVSNEAACAAATAACAARFGGIDILVNNVGILTKGNRLEDTDPADWRRGIDVNLNSAFLMTRAALPYLRESTGKAVVSIASVAGLKAYGAIGYGAAKAGLIQLTRDLALTYGPEGLRANVIAPGHIRTPMVANVNNAADFTVRREVAPLELEGDAWDIAQAAVFLASAEARFISAACLAVDGGASEIGPLVAVQRHRRRNASDQ